MNSSIQFDPEVTIGRKGAARLRSMDVFEGVVLSTSSATEAFVILPYLFENSSQFEDITGGVGIVEENSQYLLVRLALETSENGILWVPAGDIVAYPSPWAAYSTGLHSDRGKYGRLLRLKIIYKSSSGGNTGSGRVSAHITIKYVGM